MKPLDLVLFNDYLENTVRTGCRYTWDPKKPVYRIPEEVQIRYGEVLNEGVRCGYVSPNYTMRVTCSVYGDWCGADNIRWVRQVINLSNKW